ncbi:VapE domain-containing protein [Enterococcus avium]|uniref:VapE domain-containing protein n=1 Tax=Enterococcus avium TaxID=33945 RepID=UPI003D6A40D4
MEEEMSQFIAKEQEKADKVVELKSWQTNFRKNSKEAPIANSVFNIELVLENDLKLKGKLAFNAFTFEEILTENLNLDSLKIPAGTIEDSFTHALKSYIEKEYRFVPKEPHIQSAVINIARKNSFHPIKSYLEQARSKWDGKPRIETLLHTYLGVEQSEYAFKGMLCLMLGAIQKVYQPKGKFDFVFDFVSGQGSGKTTFLQKLFLEDKDFYTDSFSSFKEKDDYSIMQRCWCVNDDEMAVSDKTSFKILKKFASQKELEYRLPYARRSVRRAKTFVLVRTNNNEGHLKDRTGNRRFIPFRASKEKQVYHPLDREGHAITSELVQQLWGEAMKFYEEIDRPAFYVDLEQMAVEYQEEFLAVDSIDEIVYAVLEVPVPYDFYDYNDDQRASYVQGYLSNNGTRFTIGNRPVNVKDTNLRDRIRIKDISIEGFNEQYGKNNKRDNKIRLIMDNHPEWYKSTRNGLRFGKVKATGYIRKHGRQADR